MLRSTVLVATFLLALLPAAVSGRPQAPSPTGNWKFRVPQGEETITFLFAFSQADGKWVGDYVGSSARLKAEPNVERLEVVGDKVQLVVGFGGREFLNLDGVLSKDGKKIAGSFSQFGGPLQLTELYPTKLRKIEDPVDLARENLQQLDLGPAVFDAGFAVLGQAGAKKIPADEVRQIVDRLAKSASAYGPRWEGGTALKLATTLADQEGLADVALTQIRRAERMMADDTPTGTQMEVFGTLARLLAKGGKADEAKKYAASLTRLEAKDYGEYTKKTLAYAPEAYKGRKAKGDRVTLVEVFTGAECPPCAAVDVACDGLLVTYKPGDVVVLNYHFHVPAPDPLTSPDGMERAGFYAEQIRGAPSVFVNGKPGPKGGGPVAAGKEKYAELRAEIDKALETPGAAKIALTASPGDAEVGLKATVTELAAPGEKVMLRFALVEDRVRYAGGNGIRYHHMVVRDMPGGAKGQAVTKRDQEVTATVNLTALRGKLTKYLDDYAKTEGEFPRPERPLALANLKVVALLQNDATGEVLQAAQIDLPGKK